MLRGFRWQFIALLVASILFIISLTTRSTDNATPPVVESPTPTNIGIEPDKSPTPIPSNDITPAAPQTFVEDVPTFREALVGEVRRLNPLLASLNPVEADITSLIFEGLVRTNQYGEPEPALAHDWVISSDRLEYTFRLREDILWQDGIPFTATDVAYTMSLLRSPEFPGSEEIGEFWRTVETEQLGTYLVRFRLTQPLGSFLDALRIGILPEHALRGTTAAQIASHPFNLTPIGTGTYQLEAIRSGNDNRIQAVDLRVAPVFRQRPEGQNGYALERVSFRLFGNYDEALLALKDGNVDGLAARRTQERQPLLNVATSTNLNIYTQLEPTLGVIIYNWVSDDTRFFREQRIRLALEIGLDRTSAVERWLNNVAVRADSPIFPGSWAYTSDLAWPANNPTEARTLLETANQRLARLEEAEATVEATSEVIAEATPTYYLAFSILTPDDPALVNLTQEIAAQWSQYNLQVSVEAVDLETYRSRLDAGDFDAVLVELSLGTSADPDVFPFWHQGQYPDGKNYGGVDDRRISELLERARQDPNGINRAIYYRQFQQDFIERAIALPLYYPLYTYVTASQITGVQLGFMGSPASRFYNIRDWAIGTQP